MPPSQERSPLSPEVFDLPPRTSDEKLRNLVRQFDAQQWNVELDIPWQLANDPTQPIVGEALLPFSKTEAFRARPLPEQVAIDRAWAHWYLTQILYGEHAAMMVCSDLAAALPTLEARLCVIKQARDEARHVEAFTRFLERIGGRSVVDPVGPAMFDRIATTPLWLCQYVGTQILGESIIATGFRLLQDSTPDLVLGAILTKVLQDERRHVAFGVCMMDTMLPELAPSERRELEDFAFHCCHLFTGTPTEFTGEGGGFRSAEQLAIDLQLTAEEMASVVAPTDELWALHLQLLRHAVMPLLKRYGLVQRLAPLYTKLGLMD